MKHASRTNLGLTIAATAILTLSACTTASTPDASGPSADATTDPAPTPGRSPSPTPSGTSRADDGTTDDGATDDLAFQATCTLDASETAAGAITLSYPEDWDRSDSCDAFDPEEVQPGTDTNAISAGVLDRAYAEVVEDADSQERHVAVVDGHQAVRDEVETELGPMITWWVDLDAAADEAPGTLRVSAYDAGFVVPGVLDQMVAHARLATSEADPIEGATIVGRSEGGGTPWTAVLTDEPCAQLYGGSIAAEPASEDCLDRASEVADGRLEVAFVQFDVDRTYAVGLAGESVTAVRTPEGATYRTVPTADDRRGIAFPAQVGDEVEILAGDGSVIATQSLA